MREKEHNKNSQSLFIGALALMLLVGVTYFNVLNASFVSDDIKAIVENPAIGSIDTVFSRNLSFLRSAFLYISYSLGGPDPAYFRIFNLLFHAGTVIASFLLLTKLSTIRIAFFSAALFAVHPVLVESVTWISALPTPQYSFFLMLSLYMYVLSEKSGRRLWYSLSLAAFTLSLLSAEKAVIMPLILIILEASFFSLKSNWRRILPYVALSAILGVLFMLNLGERATVINTVYTQKTGFYNPLQQVPVAVSSYLRLIFWPDALTLYHTEELHMNLVEFAGRWAVLLAYLAGTIVAFRKNKFVFFWLSFFFITLLPTLIPHEIVWVVAERYVYLGTLGIICAFVYVLFLLVKNRRLKTVLYGFLVVVICCLMIRSALRNSDWQDQDTFWLATSRVSPSSYNARVNAGNVYLKRGDFMSAKNEYEESVQIAPGRADAYHNVANAYIAMNQSDKAALYYLKAISLNPNMWQSHQNLGVIYYKKEEYEKARREILRAISLASDDSNLRSLLREIDIRLQHQ